MTLIEHATREGLLPTIGADSQPRENAPATPQVPQWTREFEEALKACREQLLARVKAAGKVA